MNVAHLGAGPLSRFLLFVALTGCGAKAPDLPARDSIAQTPRPADTLALTTPGGVEIWFTDSRPARDSAGKPCVERVMQIRRSGQRIAVPLLYTGSIPRVINDSTIEAPIWLNCRPGNVYQVDLKTGRPARVK
jgi:hypothetical protein